MSVVDFLLSKLVFRRSIGLYVGDTDLTLSEMTWTPLGVKQGVYRVEPVDAESLPEVLERMLRPWRGRRGKLTAPVSVGVSPFRVFFSSRPIKLTDKNLSPANVLHEILQSSNVNVEEMEVETKRGQPGKQPLISLLACKRRYLLSFITPLLQCGIRPYRVEPSPFAILRLATKLVPPPRKSKAVLRVFLGEHQSVAIVVCGSTPLAWRSFDLTSGNEVLSIRSGIMALQMVIRFRGEIPKPDLIMIHGRADLEPLLNNAEFLESMGLKAGIHPEPSLDPAFIAKGLALGVQQPEEEGYDLSRVLKPRPSFWDILPSADIIMQTALLVALGLFLADYRDDVTHKLNQVNGDISKHPWMKQMNVDKLTTEKNETAQKVEAIQTFLESRILWSSYMKNTTETLPASMTLKSFMGLCGMPATGKKGGGKTKKSLVMRFNSPIPEGQVMPLEVEGYITTLRNDALLKRDFPLIEVGDLKWQKPSSKSKNSLADFIVNCLPKAEKPVAPPKAKDEKKEGH